MNSVRLGRIVARLLWLSMWIAHKCNLIQVHINPQQHRAIQSGGLVVYANHPSMIETLSLRYVLDTLTDHEGWTVTDERVFPAAWHDALQCVPVCRLASVRDHARRINLQARKMITDILGHGGIIVVYPEGGRTCNAGRIISDATGTRQVGACKVTFLKPAFVQGAALQPVWIEHGDCSTPQGFRQGYLKLLQGIPITIRFGQVYPETVSPETITSTLLAAAEP